MMEYVIDLDGRVGSIAEDQLSEFLSELEQLPVMGPAASYNIPTGALGARFNIHAAHQQKAIAAGMDAYIRAATAVGLPEPSHWEIDLEEYHETGESKSA